MPIKTGLFAMLLVGGLGACGSNGSEQANPSAPTPTHSAASTSPPSVSVTAEPTPALLTSFSDSFDDDDNGWALPPSPDGNTEMRDGDFVWTSRSPQLAPHVIAATLGDAYDRGTLAMTDVSVRASVTPRRGHALLGLTCREVPDSDSPFQWYEFVARDGYAAIRVGDEAGHVDVLAERTDVALPLGRPARLAASCLDDADGSATLSLTVNGRRAVVTTVATPFGNGAPGLVAYDDPDATDRFLLAWHYFAVDPA